MKKIYLSIIMKIAKDLEQKINKTIGSNITVLRRYHNVTQVDVAGWLGVSFQQVQKYEAGRTPLQISQAVILAEKLKVSLSDLCNSNGFAIKAINS